MKIVFFNIAILLMMIPSSSQGISYKTKAENPLNQLTWLIGSFEGSGQSQMGPYQETIEAKWDLNKSVIILRSKSVAQGMVVFEDIRIFSYDSKTQKIRARQYALGDLAEYNVEVSKSGIILNESNHEGHARAEWKYSISKKNNGFAYKVETKINNQLKKYVHGSLKRK